jgi:O-antigen/teichoic acid export membrane protein
VTESDQNIKKLFAGNHGRPGMRSLLSNSAYLTATRVGTQVVRVIYILAIARVLGPELYGLLAYGQSWYMAFLPIALLGLGAIISREIGRDPSNAPTFLATTITLRVLAALLAAIISASLGWLLENDATARQLLLIFSLALAGRALAIWAEHVFVAHERSRYVLIHEAIFRPLEVLIGIGLLFSGSGVLALAVLHAIVWWLQAFLSFAVVRARLVAVVPSWDNVAVGRMLRATWPIAIATFIAGWLMQGPLVLYRHQPGVTEAALGQLALPLQMVMVLSTIPWSVGTAALPILARSVERGDQKDTLFLEMMTRIAILGGCVAGIVGLAFAEPLTVWVFGQRFAEGGKLLGLAVWLMIPLTIGTAASPSLLARGHRWSLVVGSLVGVLLLIVLIPPLVQYLGAVGALAAAGAGLTSWAMILYAFHRGQSRPRFGLALLRPSAVLVIVAGTYLGLKFALGPIGAVAVALAIGVPAARLMGALTAVEWAHVGRLLRMQS